jgi:Flp pilus assembly protein TadG
MLRINHEQAERERGAVAVEFALVMPLLLLILFGTIEFGRVYSEWQVFNAAAREGARCAAVQATEFNQCDVATSIHDAAHSYANDLAPESSWSITPASGCTDATHGQDVTVSWPQPLKIDVPFWDNVTVTPTISATFRCE